MKSRFIPNQYLRSLLTAVANRWTALTAAAALAGGLCLAQTGCYYDDPGYRGRSGPHHFHHGKLKPKEKARLGYGRHAGHPHGGPPGQRKKRWR